MDINQGTLVDLRAAFDIAVTLVAFFGGWLLKAFRDDIKSLKEADAGLAKALSDLRVELPTHYTPKKDFEVMGKNIVETLHRIEDKLDRKADK